MRGPSEVRGIRAARVGDDHPAHVAQEGEEEGFLFSQLHRIGEFDQHYVLATLPNGRGSVWADRQGTVGFSLLQRQVVLSAVLSFGNYGRGRNFIALLQAHQPDTRGRASRLPDG